MELTQSEPSPYIWLHAREKMEFVAFSVRGIEIREVCGFKTTQEGTRVNSVRSGNQQSGHVSMAGLCMEHIVLQKVYCMCTACVLACLAVLWGSVLHHTSTCM